MIATIYSQKSYMRLVLLIGMLAVVTGCTSAVHLRDKEGKTVQCGPYFMSGGVVARERGCISDYQRQGYERVME